MSCCCPNNNPVDKYVTPGCVHRDYRDQPGVLSALLIKAKNKIFKTHVQAVLENSEEAKYRNYNYNASFHKGLQHNLVDGRLVSTQNYDKMKLAIYKGFQKDLAEVPLATGATVKLVNPLASLCTLLIGAAQNDLKLVPPPTLSSGSGAAEMVELYAQAVARDVPFINYESDLTISQLLGPNYMNNLFVRSNLPYAPPTPFTPKNIFRGNAVGDTTGPYISQLFYLSANAGAMKIPQIYTVPPTRQQALSEGFRVEWGVDLSETINTQNGNLALLPPPTPTNKLQQRYIYSGRSLAEVVHNDPPYQFFYNASVILAGLGAKANPGFPVYSNQAGFITGMNSPSVQCAIADVTGYALKHAWYWKWQHYRKLRPEVFALWVHDVKSGLVSNQNNFDIADFLLTNSVLNDIKTINNNWVPGSNSFTLPQAYREGSPLHPAYMSGHAIIAGACCTVFKIFYDAEKPWLSLPGVISGALNGIAGSLVQSNENGTALIPYNGNDAINITLADEINKLASNVGIGRDWAGIHYRSDAAQGLELGEQVAIYYVQDLLSTMVENNLDGTVPQITFRKFNGSMVTIKPTICY